MSRFGPSRGELKLRLALSLAGLILVVVALFFRGAPSGAVIFEIGGIAGLFLGGIAVWSARQLLRRNEE